MTVGERPINPYVDEYGRPRIGPGGGTTAGEMQAGYPDQSLGEQIIQAIRDAFSLEKLSEEVNKYTESENPVETWQSALQDTLIILSIMIQNFMGGNFELPQNTSAQTEVPPVKTSLKIDLQSQSQLIVDGRVLADIIKPFCIMIWFLLNNLLAQLVVLMWQLRAKLWHGI